MTDSDKSQDTVKKNLFKFINSTTKNMGDARHTLEQVLYDTGEILSIKLFHKKNTKIVKVTIKQLSDDKFGVRVKKDDDVSEKEMNLKDLKKYLSDNKDFSFALDYINKDMSSFRTKLKTIQKGGGNCYSDSKKKRSKKKSSKRKASKRKGSKRKGSKKKASKRKGSKRKASKKRSKKASRKKN